MKKISLQLRITLMTGLLIAITCITMNLLMNRTASFYIDSLGGYVNNFENGNEIYINIPQYRMNDFLDKFSDEVTDTKVNFNKRAWIITLSVTSLGSIVAYFVSGQSLKPLKDFSEQIEQIQMKNITEYRVNEDVAKEFRVLSKSFNQMLFRLSNSFENQRQLTGRAAHELRTPLAVIASQLDLYKDLPMTDAEREDLILKIKNETDRLSKLLTSLLDMSELNSIPRNEKIELLPLIDEVIQDLSSLADKKNISIRNKCEEINILGSDILLYRVFFNLIENAIKYNKENGFINISSIKNNNFAEIFIEDSGIGIDFQERENIFKPFYRADKSKDKIKGSGLGLALVYETLKLHGGDIKVIDSSIGSKFKISLPLNKI
ncbi:signal transduction histidine kinase [Peptoniphilus koenoeneniae]|uniref:histidine kinase n=1 Tax=Peptoniphilus koenoeneniae TaxID=507751 RepID=A0ABU0AVX0_9FIRM|nr:MULTISPECIES: HAMP domain-containing sensor histidine kinase [Peptoniphilus]ERT57502.1 GHKL domain protein [Peptoniphilus sp. BV3C26]MDQ0275413.1 signal transduction histidine kinase [Peptoniphilus koenoeneniae]